MAGTPLAALGDPTPVDLAFLAGELATVALGLVISYIAYRGYRQNGARPMLFVSGGFLLSFGVPAVAAGVWVALPGVPEVAVGAVGQAFEIAGMACVLYGLRLEPE